MSLSEARSLFFKHVDNVIFSEHEIRSLQAILVHYKRIAGDYGYQVVYMKLSCLKELLLNEHQETIGFKARREINNSEWVYDVPGGGDYIDRTMSCLGISDDQHLLNVAKRLPKRVKNTPTVAWPPNVDHPEEGKEVCESLVQLLTWLKQPKRKSVDLSPTILILASMIA